MRPSIGVANLHESHFSHFEKPSIAIANLVFPLKKNYFD